MEHLSIIWENNDFENDRFWKLKYVLIFVCGWSYVYMAYET